MIWISMCLLALSFLTLLIAKNEYDKAWLDAYNRGYEAGAGTVLRKDYQRIDEFQNKKD